MEDHWDKKLVRDLLSKGLTYDHARSVVGVVAEHRQIADHEGYVRGFNDGYDKARLKYETSGSP